MNYRMLGRFIGKILVLELVFMVPALCISIFGGEWQSAVAFLKTMGLIFVLAHGLIFFGRKSKKNFFAKEGHLMTLFHKFTTQIPNNTFSSPVFDCRKHRIYD